MSLPKKVYNYLLTNRELDLDNPRVQIIRVNECYTDWVLQVAQSLNVDDFAVMQVMMMLEAMGVIVVVTPDGLDYIEYVEVKDG